MDRAGQRPDSALSPRLTGLLGGSFNPAHPGHRHISRLAISLLGLDEIWWLVSPGNPLKAETGMAPLSARLASAHAMSRRLPIRATAIEAQLGSRYTVDSLHRLRRRFPKRRFIWLMGADNLATFHHWRRWREIARTVPIAVIIRPGYDKPARTAPVMSWFRRFVRPGAQARNWTNWRPPALVILSTRPDRTSATAIRARDPRWHDRFPPRALRDPISRKLV